MLSLSHGRLARAAMSVPAFFCRSASPASSATGGLISSSCSIPTSTSGALSSTSALMRGCTTRTFSTTATLWGGFRCCCPVLLAQHQPSHASPSSGRGFAPQPRNPSQLRLHGTVTAFKHRRGYGFILAEGVVRAGTVAVAAPPRKAIYASLESLEQQATKRGSHASDTAATSEQVDAEAAAEAAAQQALHQAYFFVRVFLDGGFFVTEGERVAFDLEEVAPKEGTSRHLKTPSSEQRQAKASASSSLTRDFSLEEGEEEGSIGSPVDDLSTGDDAAADEAATSQQPLKQRVCATKIRSYDLKTGKESPITPITLYGKVVEWDAVQARGTIAELDLDRQYHEDAPRFPASIEDFDLGSGTNMHAGRYVRFCLGTRASAAAAHHQRVDPDSAASAVFEEEDLEDAPSAAAASGSELVAQRIIVDIPLERRRGAYGRPLAPATATPGSVNDQTRFSGLIREIRSGHFGFVVDDLSGESIFFHSTNAMSGLQEGDRVTYLLREMTFGKHRGKKACYDVRRVKRSSSSRRSHDADAGATTGRRSATLGELESDESGAGGDDELMSEEDADNEAWESETAAERRHQRTAATRKKTIRRNADNPRYDLQS